MVEDVYEEACKAAEYVRANSRPFFIQAHTIRFNEHQEGAYYRRMIETGYRDYSLLKEEKKTRCPIKIYAAKLIDSKIIASKEIAKFWEEAKEAVLECVEFAKASPEPDEVQAITQVFREA